MESGTIRKLGAVSYSPSILYIKYGAILYHVRDIATYWLKIAKFLRGGGGGAKCRCEKNRDFRPMSQTIQNSAIVTILVGYF